MAAEILNSKAATMPRADRDHQIVKTIILLQ